MKLHYVQYTATPDGEEPIQRASFHASGDAASKAGTALKQNDSIDRKSVKRASIEVPTKKEELVGFLTTLCASDLHDALDVLGEK